MPKPFIDKVSGRYFLTDHIRDEVDWWNTPQSQEIADVHQAKLRYRELAKQLHPDTGGTVSEFQKMQEEYNATLLRNNFV